MEEMGKGRTPTSRNQQTGGRGSANSSPEPLPHTTITVLPSPCGASVEEKSLFTPYRWGS